MTCLSRLSVALLLVVLGSCAAYEPNQPVEIADIRTDIERCPAHDELLIEATNRVDFERGQFMPPYYDIRKALFPAAYDDPFSVGELARVTYCPKCRAAKQKYLRDTRDMSNAEFQSLDLDAFLERQRRELDAETAAKKFDTDHGSR